MTIMPYDVLIKKLRDFSLPLNLVQSEHERRIVTAVVRKLAQLSDDALFRVYKVKRHEGRFILDLIAHSGGRNAPDKEIWIDKIDKKGALSWCLDHGDTEQGFWVSDIKASADRGALKNKLTGEPIGDEYTDFIDDPNSIVAIPLKSNQSNVIGVLAVQFENDQLVSKTLVNVLLAIAPEVARIMRKATETESYVRNSTEAVEGFLDDILNVELSPDILEERPSIGFIARPFSNEFNEIGKHLEDLLSKNNISVSTYDPDRAGGIVAEQIVSQIKACLFGVADITGSNPNVLMEVGVMIAEGKDLILLKRFDDDSETPFNVAGYHAHHYRVANGGSIEIKRPDENVFQPFDKVLSERLKAFMG